ncbi:hypothetical protein [Butyrivibrio sp. CB08]|uniref:hypothetical protein n=1 Tax=Butyrivibrio sp. CB08 TaxID=2364879 RepID=UPI001FAA3B19|nr:hypothetical protein [Butyrivibrio sp. CB08]
MAMWAHEVTLLKEAEATPRTNSNGFPIATEPTERTVFCNKKSVGYAEYFSSQQAGLTASLKVELYKVDYEGELLVVLEGKRYSVLKTYEINDDLIELTLSDLKQQATNVEPQPQPDEPQPSTSS